MKLDELIARYEEESKVMLRCADLNPREDGGSYYAHRAVLCVKIVETLKFVKLEQR